MPSNLEKFTEEILGGGELVEESEDEFLDRMIEYRKREKERHAYHTRRGRHIAREDKRVDRDAYALRGTPHGVVPALYFKPDWWNDAV